MKIILKLNCKYCKGPYNRNVLIKTLEKYKIKYPEQKEIYDLNILAYKKGFCSLGHQKEFEKQK